MKGHVESDGLLGVESHGLVGHSDVRKGRVEGMVVGERVELIGVEGGSIEEMGFAQ